MSASVIMHAIHVVLKEFSNLAPSYKYVRKALLVG